MSDQLPLCARCGENPVATHPLSGVAKICHRCFLVAIADLMVLAGAFDELDRQEENIENPEAPQPTAET